MTLCITEGCNRPVACKGLCDLHYRRQRRGIPSDKPLPHDNNHPCTVEGCEAKAHALGMCKSHYCRRWYTLSRPESKPKPPKPLTCIAEGCEKQVSAKDLCKFHYERQRLGKPIIPPVKVKTTVCSVEECDREPKAREMCSLHYHQWRAQVTRGQRQSQPIGSRRTNANGYIEVKVRPVNGRDRGWETEHRLLMAEAIQRPLYPDEEVHHKNGDRSDNRLDNLELWSRSQPSGQRVIDKLAWAEAFVSRYEGSNGILNGHANN